MGMITVEQIVTVDGFAAEPDGGLGFFDAFDADDDRTDHSQLAWLESVDAILLGRRTYEMFAGFWPTADASVDAVAAWINAAPARREQHARSGALGGREEVEVHRDGPSPRSTTCAVATARSWSGAASTSPTRSSRHVPSTCCACALCR